MTDIYDQADHQAEQSLAFSLKERARKAKDSAMLACGLCFNCEEPVRDGLLFCDKGCRDDYQLWLGSKERNGR